MHREVCSLCGKPSNYGPRHNGIIAHDACAMQAFVGLGLAIKAFERSMIAEQSYRSTMTAFSQWRKLLTPAQGCDYHSLREHVETVSHHLVKLWKLAAK